MLWEITRQGMQGTMVLDIAGGGSMQDCKGPEAHLPPHEHQKTGNEDDALVQLPLQFLLELLHSQPFASQP